MPSEPAFRRHDPNAWMRSLAYRHREALPYDGTMHPGDALLMLDTTVYIDAQRIGFLPGGLVTRIAAAPIRHSAVAVGELASTLGALDPSHRETPAARAQIETMLSRIPPERVHAPSADAWAEAAVIAGILARTQGLPKEDRRKLLNDALIFLSAIEAQAVLVSRNARDVDLLLRFRPEARVLLYDRATP